MLDANAYPEEILGQYQILFFWKFMRPMAWINDKAELKQFGCLLCIFIGESTMSTI